MIALLSGRLRIWLIASVALPVLGFGARKISQRLESRQGPSAASRALRKTADLAQRRSTNRSR